MLGMEEDLTQLRHLAKFKWVKGIDGSKPIVYGLYGIQLSENGTNIEYPHRPYGYFDIEKVKYPEVINSNITQVMNWSNAE